MTCKVSGTRVRYRPWQQLLLVLTTLVYLPACAQTGGAPGHSIPGGTTPVVVGDFTPDDIDSLVAPIALYPDDLLAIVLPASSYPLQIVQAARFLDAVEQDPSLRPDETWDDSVVALLNYPEVVRMMNDDLDWTWRLGQAVLAQQPDVIAAIEDFRDRAYAAGNLQSDTRQVVGRDDGAIYIRPADPEVIYVPYYEPTQVIVRHTRPVYHYYPRPYPVYYYPYPVGHSFASGFFFGVTTYYTLGWNTRHLYLYDYNYYAHPFYGRPTVYHHHHYYYRQPRKVVHNHYYDSRDRNDHRREDYRWRHDGRTYDRSDWLRMARERRDLYDRYDRDDRNDRDRRDRDRSDRERYAGERRPDDRRNRDYTTDRRGDEGRGDYAGRGGDEDRRGDQRREPTDRTDERRTDGRREYERRDSERPADGRENPRRPDGRTDYAQRGDGAGPTVQPDPSSATRNREWRGTNSPRVPDQGYRASRRDADQPRGTSPDGNANWQRTPLQARVPQQTRVPEQARVPQTTPGADIRPDRDARGERNDRLTRMAQPNGSSTWRGERPAPERVQPDRAQQRQRIEQPAAAPRGDTMLGRAYDRARAAERARAEPGMAPMPASPPRVERAVSNGFRGEERRAPERAERSERVERQAQPRGEDRAERFRGGQGDGERGRGFPNRGGEARDR